MINCDRLIKMIQELIDKKFYGVIELRFETGNIVSLKKTETYAKGDLEKIMK